jgi:signal transduction histidine kinase
MGDRAQGLAHGTFGGVAVPLIYLLAFSITSPSLEQKMASSISSIVAFKWFNATAANMAPYVQAQQMLEKMATVQVVTAAATSAAGTILTTVQDLIYADPDLVDVADVAERMQVFSDDSNVYVGIPDGDEAETMLQQLLERSPVLDTAFTLAGPKAQQDFVLALQREAS